MKNNKIFRADLQMNLNSVTLHDGKIFNLFGEALIKTMIGSSKPVLDSTGETDNLFELSLGLSVDSKNIERSNYTLLQFVGDVGALSTTLFTIGGFILSIFVRKNIVLENYLLNEVFR